MGIVNKLNSSLFFVLRDKFVEWRLSCLDEKEKFRLIYKTRYWKEGGEGSKSGAGSDMRATDNIRKSLPEFLKKFNIRSMLDIPCGDFYWMSTLNLHNVDYIGADIVPEMIRDNNERYARKNLKFKVMDLVDDSLPDCDLIFSRDCLVHLLDEQVQSVIDNVRQSNAKFFATTMYADIDKNKLSKESDRWRPLNLTLEPFYLPEPFEILDDSWPENPVDVCKKIAVWRIQDLH